MADSLKKIKDELERFIAAISELAPDKIFGGVTLDSLKADESTMHAKDRKVEQDEAALKGSQVDRKTFYEAEAKKLELVKNGVIGDPDFGPDSPLYGAMGFKRTSERASGLTRKEKEPEA
jgi:hypothetical protein